jgi:hypothetical protein
MAIVGGLPGQAQTAAKFHQTGVDDFLFRISFF